jgi:hypothetical protein
MTLSSASSTEQGLPAEAEQHPVVRHRGDEQGGGGRCRQQGHQVGHLREGVVALEAVRERQRQEEGEQDLHAHLRHPQLLQQLGVVPLPPLEVGLVVALWRLDTHGRLSTPLRRPPGQQARVVAHGADGGVLVVDAIAAPGACWWPWPGEVWCS